MPRGDDNKNPIQQNAVDMVFDSGEMLCDSLPLTDLAVNKMDIKFSVSPVIMSLMRKLQKNHWKFESHDVWRAFRYIDTINS